MDESFRKAPIETVLNDTQSFVLERGHVGKKVEERQRRGCDVVFLLESLAHPVAAGPPSGEVDQKRAGQFSVRAIQSEPGDERAVRVSRWQRLEYFQIAEFEPQCACESMKRVQRSRLPLENIDPEITAGQHPLPR